MDKSNKSTDTFEQLKKMFHVIWIMTVLLIIANCINTLLLLKEFRRTTKQIATAINSMSGSREDASPIEFKMNEFKTEKTNTIGDPDDAEAVMLAFIDYRCGHCRQYMKDVFPKIRNEYIDKGKIIYIAMDYPISDNIIGMEAALCAGDEGKFWDMQNLVINTPNTTNSDKGLTKLAQEMGINIDKFSACLTKHTYIDKIKRNKEYAEKIGVNGTPTFFIGPYNNKNKTIIASRIVGFKSYDEIKKQIDMY